jgi:excisionase family DNA binding protein
MTITEDTPIAALSVKEFRKLIQQGSPLNKPAKNLSPEEAVEILNEKGYKITKTSLYRLTGEKAIPFRKFGKKLLFDEEQIIEWAESRTTQA